MAQRTAIVIGAGPAGLTAAYELLQRTDIQPIVLEASGDIGGISKTVVHDGNRIDIGGHRFFSKSDRVVEWWLNILPLDAMAEAAEGRDRLRATTYSDRPKTMLIRQRVSRILFQRRFFDYPLSLSAGTLRNIGLAGTLRIGSSYLRARLFPIRPEATLEEFFINRFGGELYRTFFRDYTAKVWGVPCSQIPSAWGVQRVKGLSISRAVAHAVRGMLPRRRQGGLLPSATETSLVERFLYPKCGPGQLWEEVAERILARGGTIQRQMRVTGIEIAGARVRRVIATGADGRTQELAGDFVFSTMPIRDLVRATRPEPPAEVREVADGLIYRDFLTVGLLVRKLRVRNETSIRTDGGLVPDNWIYVQDSDVQVGRIQIFNNWSPFMVRDPDLVWMGLEYFCNVGDPVWVSSDEELRRLAVTEMDRLGLVDPAEVLDHTVVRMAGAYPAYFGTYDRLHVVREHCDRIENLFLLGRNGQHRYNNQDHSMLTAMVAVDNILQGVTDKSGIWSVNTETDYHEAKREIVSRALRTSQTE